MDWERLGLHVRRDRVRLGMRTQAQLAARSGLSKRTVGDVERGARTNVSPDTLGAIEAALGWEPGAALAILQGKTPPSDTGLAQIATAWPGMGERERQIVLAIVEILTQS